MASDHTGSIRIAAGYARAPLWRRPRDGAADIRQTVRLKRGDRVKFTLALAGLRGQRELSVSHPGKRQVPERLHQPCLVSKRAADDGVAGAGRRNSSTPLGLAAAGWLRPMPALRLPCTMSLAGADPHAQPPAMDFMLDPNGFPPTGWDLPRSRGLLGPDGMEAARSRAAGCAVDLDRQWRRPAVCRRCRRDASASGQSPVGLGGTRIGPCPITSGTSTC